MDPMYLLKQELEKANLRHEQIKLKRSEFLKQEGSIDTHLYLIKSGSVRVYERLENGEENCLYFGYSNSLITAVDSFFGGVPSSYIIQSIKQTTVQRIKKADFDHFVQSSKSLLVLWQKVLIELIQHHLERTRDLSLSSAKERYESLQKRRPELFQEIPQKYLASYLRMSPETLSRLHKT